MPYEIDLAGAFRVSRAATSAIGTAVAVAATLLVARTTGRRSAATVFWSGDTRSVQAGIRTGARVSVIAEVPLGRR
jgi:hypothetical protein